MADARRRSPWPRFLLLFLVFAVPLTAIIHLQVRSTRRHVEQAAARRTVAMAELGATAVDEYLRGMSRYAEAYTRSPALRDAVRSRNEDRVRGVLAELLRHNPRVDRVLITDPRGVEWSDFPPDPSVIGRSFAHRDWYRGVASRESTYVSSVYARSAGKQEHVIAIATPVREAGRTHAYLVTQALVASLERQLARPPSGESGEREPGDLLVLDRAGAIVTRIGQAARPHPTLLAGARAACADPARPVTRLERDGRAYLVAHAPVPSLEGCVVALRDVESALAATRSITRVIDALALALALLLAIFVHILLERRSRRIEDLRRQEAFLESQVAERTESLSALVKELRAEVAERLRAEASLRESERRFRGTFEQAAVGIAHFAADGTFLRVNQRLCDILGFSRHELLKKALADLVRPEDLIDVEGCPDASILERLGEWKEGICRVEREILRKDRTRVWCHLTLAPVNDERGEPEYYTAVVEDITERKQLEEQILMSQKLRAIGQLAGGVAHDFNNLLTTILGYCELLQRRLGPNDPLRTYVDEIAKAGERATSLTAQLLAFGRKQILHPLPIDLNEVVVGVERLLRRLIGEDIALEARLASDLVTVKADPGQIEQVLMNLVVNARDAMPRGGRVIIETGNVELDEASVREHPGLIPGMYATVAVTDTGIGMDADTQAQLFEPFFTTKDKGKGTGLGLSTVYGIVKQSGGAITVRSAPHRGSTFRVYLPRADAPAVPVSPQPGRLEDEAAQEAVGGTETILLVEDEEVLRSLTRRVLEEHGYRVLEAANGPDAIAVARGHAGPIHALLSDVVMPAMSGAMLAGRIREIHPETQVVLMSGYTDDEMVRHRATDPRVAFLQKPYTPAGLLRAIRNALDAGSSAIRS